jgi:hypothetical protein
MVRQKSKYVALPIVVEECCWFFGFSETKADRSVNLVQELMGLRQAGWTFSISQSQAMTDRCFIIRQSVIGAQAPVYNAVKL